MEKREWSTQFYLNNFSLSSLGHSEPDRFLIRLFQKSSIVKFSSPIIDTMQLGTVEDTEKYQHKKDRVGFRLSAGELKERLEILGYSLTESKIDFENAKAIIIQRLEQYENRDQESANFPHFSAFESYQSELEYISKINFEDFLFSSGEMINNSWRRVIEIEQGKKRSIIPHHIENRLTRHLVCNGFGVIPFKRKLTLIRGLLETLDNTDLVFYEFDGYPDVSLEELDTYYEQLFSPNEINTKYGLKTLIATEGKTDTEFIEKSLAKLYPHLTDLYSFLDFELRDGSAQALIQIVKSLASSGIPNNIIAIFDNDIEGVEAMQRVSEIQFPENVRVLCYPNIHLGASYPVRQMNNGEIILEDVNGNGGAIELYLGKDVLTNDEGDLFPLSVKNEKRQMNFGRNKNLIQQRFQEKLEDNINNGEWDDMRSILEMIFSK